jgi:uncharacterized protein (TIRG00374 family)
MHPACGARPTRTVIVRSGRPGLPSIAIGLVVGGIATYAILSAAGGLAETFEVLRRIDMRWLVAAGGAEIISYMLLGAHLRRLAGRAVGLAPALGVSLIWFGLGNLLPGAPAPGLALAAAELPYVGIEPGRARMVLGLSAWFNGRTFLLVAALGCVVAVGTADTGAADPGVLALVAVALVVFLAATAWLTSREASARRSAQILGRFVPRRLRRQRFTPEAASAWHSRLKATVGTRQTRGLLIALGVGSWLADGACLYLILRGVGLRISPNAVLIAYVAGMAVSLLPLLPGGLGVVEATVPAVLHRFGAPVDLALAGTLMYRGLAFFLPAAAGGVTLILMRSRHGRAGARGEPQSSDAPAG